MPVDRQIFDQYGLLLARPHEPFSFTELLGKIETDMKQGIAQDTAGLPYLLDFRQVDLMRFGTDEIRKVIRQRVELNLPVDNPSVLLAGDKGSYGMLRMYAAYAEIEGLRSEESTHVTASVPDAVAWLLPRLSGPEPLSRDALTRLVG